MNWQGKKVLVAGGAGMIGSHMSKRLVKEGAKVTVADNLTSGSMKNLEEIRKDIDFRFSDLRIESEAILVTMEKDVVFQFAANMGGIGYITRNHSKIVDDTKININMMVAAQKEEVPLYFYSSSACVYANYKQREPEVTPLREADAYPADCNEPYGWEKLYSEIMAQTFQEDYGMNIKIARFHNIFGEMYTCFDKEKGKAPCHLILKAIKHPEPPMVIWGKGNATRSFLYVDDCVEAILRLMDSDYNKPINIGSDRLISVDELANTIINISGKQIVPTHDLTKPEGVKGRNADLSLVRRVLNWEPQVTLEQGLSITYDWALKHFNELENI